MAVGWQLWIPANLRACWTTTDGLNLKPSHTTETYTGGSPASMEDLKPSIVNYATGNVRAGLTNSGDSDLSPSVLTSKVT